MNRVFDTHVHCLSINLITTLKVFHLQLFTMYIQSFDCNRIPFPSIPKCYIWRQKESKQLPWRTWVNCHNLEILLVGWGWGGQGTKVPLLRSSSLILVFSSSLVPLDDKFLVSRISVTCPKVMFSGLGQGPVSCRKSCNQRQIQTKS